MPAPIVSIKQQINAMGIGVESKKELLKLLQTMNAANKAAMAKLDALSAKLNADAGVTDTNYATDNATSYNAIIKD